MLKKVKRRYLALKIDSTEKIGSKELIDSVWNAVLKLYGEYGASQTGLTLISYDDERQLAVIRVAHTALKTVRASIATITRIGEKPATIHILTVSGTIKTLNKRMEKAS
ncbi:MAG: Rpp14/Pop5 family protein [Candidatus Bathyarchaeia archaeon]